MSQIESPKTVCVLGLGYIGLPTASMFATHGHRVIGVDVNPRIVHLLKEGKTHIEEPGLSTVVKAALQSGQLEIESTPQAADVFIIAVPTPYHHGQQGIPTADLSFVTSAAQSILPVLKKGDLIILESTSPAGTTRDVLIPLLKKSHLDVGRDIGVAYCPERVIPGQTMRELISNDRIIGAIDQRWGELVKKLYRSFVSGEIFLTDPTVAEMAKLMENTYRDVNIALSNEMALLCEKLRINVWEVIALANRHPRVHLHQPGPGVGGHCISVDPWFLVEKFPNDATLIHAARRTNDAVPSRVVSLIAEMIGPVAEAKVTILGLAYKANVDDSRESPAIEVIKLLKARYPMYNVAVYDPLVKNADFPSVGIQNAFRDSNLAVLLTAHDEFKMLDPESVGSLMKNRRILDTHNVLKSERWLPAGFTLRRLGDGSQPEPKRVSQP